MVKFQLIVIGCFLLIAFPGSGSATIISSIRKSSATNIETEITVTLEKIKNEIDLCKANKGKSFDEIEMISVGDVGAYDMGVKVITDGLIASKYEWYGDLSKAADYYYKDYLVQSGKKPWKSKHNWGSPGDSTPFPLFMGVLEQNQDYQRMVKVYPEYFNYYFNLDLYKGSEKEKVKKLREKMKYDTELKNQYDSFMKEWQEVKRLAKTIKPKSLDPAVQSHEWFYSSKQDEVLKSLDYYFTHKVQFMLEKALSHKDPVVAAKAREYLGNLAKGETNETENKKP